MEKNLSLIVKLFNELKSCKNELDIEDKCMEIRNALAREPTLVLRDELKPYIKQGLDLKNTHPEVLYTTLFQLNLLAQEKVTDTLRYLSSNMDLIYDILDVLENNQLKLAVMAQNIVKRLLQVPIEGEKLMLTKEFSEYFNRLYERACKLSTEVQFRVFDVAAIILSKDNHALIELYNPFLMNISSTFKESTDELIQMNVIEIVITICLQTQGLMLVKNIGIFENFYSRLRDTVKVAEVSNSNISQLQVPLLNKIINFVGSVSSISNENTKLLFHYDFLQVFRYHLANHHVNGISKYFLNAIVTAIGNIGVNNSGLDLLVSVPDMTKCYMELILSHEATTSTTAMISFSIMLHNKDPLNMVSDKLYQIYQTIPSYLLSQRLLKNLSSPQEEVKKANFSLLTSLCIHSWGVDDVMKIPGFYEYLIGHFNESNKVYREWKFKIIQNIVDNHQDLFRSPEKISQFHQLTNYLRRGPHYIETESRVELGYN